MARRRYFREIRVLLECGHGADINTSRYRVSRDLAAILFMGAQRRGVWCWDCNANAMPIEFLGVYRV